jgi:hypothetical protein
MKRNDKAAVAKAAKAVDRGDVVTLLKEAFLTRPRRSPPRPVSPPTASAPSSPTPRRRRSSPRRGRGDMRHVVAGWSARFGKFGSKRYKKAAYVRDKIAKAEDGFKFVFSLVGAYYDPEGMDKLSLHDLDVMVEKGIIKIEGEK